RSARACRDSGSGGEASSSSRCDRTEMDAPAPIDRAPASSPDPPVSRMTEFDTRAAPTPRTSARWETRPPFAPKAAARAGRDRPDHRGADAFGGGHLGRGRLVVRVGRARLGLLCQREDEDGAEHATEEGQAAGDEVCGAALVSVFAQK